MNCLRCGVKTEDEQVFCDRCRAVMAENPVSPSTPVQIPRRSTPEPEKKQSHRQNLSPKETMRQMRSLLRWMAAVVAFLTVVICVLAGILLFNMRNTPGTPSNIGRNYNTVNTTQPD